MQPQSTFRAITLLFIAIPLIELYFIIVIGGMIGAFWTVLLVILTAVTGVGLLRIQGISTLMRAQRNMSQGQIPAMEMMEGVALAVAGVLLITPGFVTDSIGFLLLFQGTRQAIIRYFIARSNTSFYYTSGRPPHHGGDGPAGPGPRNDQSSGRTIEGEYRKED